ncbi:MAG TPA: tRNA1(Val) (adenine(37)-N6)-methyltransferase [Buttiauxella sp.]|uniref:tRNA(1)(Val) (adenine(37)-N(6))-methyltransferase TrmN n=1 Tax=Buttiauxella sp. TaxID=1972222 RepID=UPI002B473EF3|nr:tRNA1(Val) (adenine(37)-N6)-methyltransferase [Buttiauxella sp.]HKM98794.1 tRNA1(Val) (adenine(37)-N6)-methyltransferase [Buttiauxella sp.]
MCSQKAVLRRDGFTFKQFFVAHDRCAMKVGTDGTLLGAWVPVAQVKNVLDIGTGSGLLALMLAQRTPENVTVDAVELDPIAAEQAAENAAGCKWASRINIHCADIRDWAQQATQRYSLIVSNPPFFAQGSDCASPERAQARYTTTLDHQALLSSAAQLITEDGFFCVIMPETSGTAFTELAKTQGWFVRYRTDIADNEKRLPHRVMLALSPTDGDYLTERLIIRGPDQQYSEGYCGLTQDFYLFM